MCVATVTGKEAENGDHQRQPMSSFVDITSMYVLEAIITLSAENTGRRDIFKIFQQFSLKELTLTKI